MSPNQIQCTFEPAEITVGDKIKLSCEGIGLSGSQADAIALDVSGTEEHAFRQLSSAQLGDGKVSLEITSYKVGTQKLSALKLKVGDETFSMDGPEFKVNSVLKPTGEKQEAPTPYDIIPPGTIPYPLWWWIMWGFIAAVVLGFSIRAWLKWRRRKREISVGAAGAPLTGREKFEKGLRDLENQQLHRRGEFKAFSLELSALLRRALAEEFKFDAEEMTTEEITVHMAKKQKKAWASMEGDFRVLMDELDKIKFARIEVRGDDCQKLIEMAFRVGRVIFPAPLAGGAV